MLVFRELVTKDDTWVRAMLNKCGMLLVVHEIRLTIIQESGTWRQNKNSQISTGKERRAIDAAMGTEEEVRT